MNSNEISISLAFQHPPFLSSFVLLFFSVLSISFIPRCPLYSYFYILDTIFFIICCCFSFTLFKANQNIKSLMKKGSFRVGSSRVEGKFSDESNHKYSKIKKSDHPNFDDYDHHNQDQLLMDSTSPLKTSPICNSPWSFERDTNNNNGVSTGDTESSDLSNGNMLMGSLVREEGHIYSLAASGDLLYTGSDSKNIRVWKNQREFSGFKSNSGLVKAIVISEDRIFSGHQDGKIRLWKVSSKNPSVHKRVGTLPTMKDFFKNSIKPSRYIEGRGNKNSVWVKHFDAISCLSLSEDKTILYSASWDKTFKVWRISNSKCLESINAHDDAVNSVVAGFDGLVFTGSADGSIKVWRRELQGKGTKHFFSQILLKQECAITALAVNPEATTVYGGSSDGLVNFWERNQQLGHGGVLRGHKLAILCLVTAGSLVFSGSADMGICLWKRIRSDHHICLSVLSGHSGPVKCLAAEKDHESSSNDERWILYSGSLDKSVKIWRVSEKAPALAWNGRESAKPTTLPAAPSFSIRERSSDV